MLTLIGINTINDKEFHYLADGKVRPILAMLFKLYDVITDKPVAPGLNDRCRSLKNTTLNENTLQAGKSTTLNLQITPPAHTP